ncbi:hypothetical protein BK124_11440 [Paenibacillus amylolyticus]|uniref:hypothetical protein n=1 Tax=Paenibacillus amylolyticus TaxID=1451 RepID=UPI00096F8153|nr:hypothetical protein [Paenibacillus amylolyticus]OMF00265.1 hypothetical protein BK124_11440 [Paenibacillus amylolyticus]
MDLPLITTVCRFKLFKQPYKIGDTFEMNGETRLVVGIENFEINHYGKQINVRYTCQRLNELDFVSKAKAYQEVPFGVEIKATLRNKNWDKVSQLNLGTTLMCRGQIYKIMEYTEIGLNETDLYVRFIARPVFPVDRNTAKSKLLNERRKKLKLEII